MSHRATPGEQEAYREQGYFVRPAVFEERELEPLREAVEALHRAINRAADRGEGPVERIDGRRYQELLGSTIKWEWSEGSRAIRSMEPVHNLDPRIDALIDDARLWQPTLEEIGAETASLFTAKLNFKRPGGAPFPWHQDTPYWAFGCAHVERLASVQLYLDAASVESGCLWMIPGSHRHGVLPGRKDCGVLGKLYTDLAGRDVGSGVPIEAPAGSAIFFHGDVVHGSQTNRSGASRRALVFTYQPGGLPLWHANEPRLPLAARA